MKFAILFIYYFIYLYLYLYLYIYVKGKKNRRDFFLKKKPQKESQDKIEKMEQNWDYVIKIEFKNV